MVPRFACRLLCLVALAPTGCMSLSSWNPPALPSTIPGGESGEASKAELPAKESAKLSLNLAEEMEKNGHPIEAIAFYEKARQVDPRLQVKVCRRLAVLYDQLGQSQQALAEYQHALHAAPRDADLLNSFGYYHYTRGNWTEAEAQLRLAVAANPHHPRAWVNLGLTLGQQQRYPESLAAFGKVMGQANAYSNLAFILSTQGKREEAKQYYRDALQLDPNLPIARLALAKLERPEPPVPAVSPVAVAPRTAERIPDLSPVVVPEPVSRSPR